MGGKNKTSGGITGEYPSFGSSKHGAVHHAPQPPAHQHRGPGPGPGCGRGGHIAGCCELYLDPYQPAAREAEMELQNKERELSRRKIVICSHCMSFVAVICKIQKSIQF